MSVGLLIITHGNVGTELLNTAKGVLRVCPVPVQVLRVHPDSNPERLLEEASRLVSDLDNGDGVLVLTDMYGSTPSNIANRLPEDSPVTVVAGVNLPMLVRVLNYPRLSREELAEKAISGARDGVVLCRPGNRH